MQLYTSPFRNLGLDLTAELDKNALNLAKERLLAELDASRTGAILRGGKTMTRNQLIELFDDLSNVENLEFHRQLANNRGLLAFLEKQKVENKNQFVDDVAFASEGFKSFLNPYLAHSYSEYVLNCFKNGQSADLRLLPIDLLNQLPANDAAQVWETLRDFLKQQRAAAEDLTERIKRRDKVKKGEIQAFKSPQFVACLNWLPDSFQDFRTGYVASLFYLAEAAWKIKAHKTAVDVLRYAENINCVEQNKKVVQARLYIYETTLDQTVKIAQQERAFGYVLGAIAAIIVGFFAFSLRPSPPKKEEPKVDRTFVFKENMLVADTIPQNDSIPLVSQDFQKILHNPHLSAKEKSQKSKFLVLRIDTIKKDSTNKGAAGATRQFILTFTKDFDRIAAEEDPSVRKGKVKR